MKFTSLLSVISVIGAGVMAQDIFDVDELVTREYESHDLVVRAMHNLKRHTEDHIELLTRAVEELDNALYARWGSGKYVIDDNTYHRSVKPILISTFSGKPGFKGLCGSNPDFHVERDGTVYPTAVDKKAKQAGKCTKSKYNENMHDTLIRYIAPPSRSPSPAGRHRRSEFEDFDLLD
ncbi:hypothetical protein GALMADRAFT_240169 [Galerina marginata CBS 339.88]|uniref:Uncharacterized protein n=1 Tax=Galerina marginata (strain CBS 339.88) TaxID=685588 RepID=A0A067TFG9_GALM3|nr:hypothetical protein GALMADRAFT_240169 [Galerina marginata CBS 339.88]